MLNKYWRPTEACQRAAFFFQLPPEDWCKVITSKFPYRGKSYFKVGIALEHDGTYGEIDAH